MKKILFSFFAAVLFLFAFSSCKTDVNSDVEAFKVEYSKGDKGALSVTLDGKDFESGSAVAKGKTLVFEAVPNSGFRTVWDSLLTVSPDDNNKATLTVTKAVNVAVGFKDIYKVSYSFGEHGQLNVLLDGAEFKSGDYVDSGKVLEFTATPEEGYKTNWDPELTVSSDDKNKATLTVTKLTDVTVAFSPMNEIVYRVKHYKQNIENDEYTIVTGDTEIKKGDAHSTTEAGPKFYEGFDAKPIEQKTIKPDGSTVVDVYYLRKSATLNFSAEGGKWEDETTSEKTVSGRFGAPVNPPSVKRLGYIFNKWNPDYKTIPASNASVKAEWKAITYTVRFDNNGGDGTMEAQVFKYDEPQTLRSNNFSKNGYEFDFWTTNSDGSGKQYEKSATVKNLTATDGEVIVLYPKWVLKYGYYLGNPTGGQSEGSGAIESWMEGGNLKLNGRTIEKTSENIIIPTGTVRVLTMRDDSSYIAYAPTGGVAPDYQGVFIKGRNVKLSPFVMSKHEVTQELYIAVTGENPSDNQKKPEEGDSALLRPVENVKWHNAIAFCNALTVKVMGEDKCVYYSDESLTKIYNKSDADGGKDVYPAYDKIHKKWIKLGYRLPTEAEWEYASRGGDPNAPRWKYSYAGVNTDKGPSDFLNQVDLKLNDYAWYKANSPSNHTREVGKRECNALGLYDMSGNVSEWCFDYHYKKLTVKDDDYKDSDGYVLNPAGPSFLPDTYSYRVRRGGSVTSHAYACAVSARHKLAVNDHNADTGFRLVRSTE